MKNMWSCETADTTHAQRSYLIVVQLTFAVYIYIIYIIYIYIIYIYTYIYIYIIIIILELSLVPKTVLYACSQENRAV